MRLLLGRKLEEPLSAASQSAFPSHNLNHMHKADA